MGRIGCPQTSVRKCHSTLRNKIPKERRSQIECRAAYVNNLYSHLEIAETARGHRLKASLAECSRVSIVETCQDCLTICTSVSFLRGCALCLWLKLTRVMVIKTHASMKMYCYETKRVHKITNLRTLHLKIVCVRQEEDTQLRHTYKSPSVGDGDDIRSFNSNNVLFSIMYLFHYHTSRSWLFGLFILSVLNVIIMRFKLERIKNVSVKYYNLSRRRAHC